MTTTVAITVIEDIVIFKTIGIFIIPMFTSMSDIPVIAPIKSADVTISRYFFVFLKNESLIPIKQKYNKRIKKYRTKFL